MENLYVLVLIKNLCHVLEVVVSTKINGVNGQIGQYVALIVRSLGSDNVQMKVLTVKVPELRLKVVQMDIVKLMEDGETGLHGHHVETTA